MKAGLSVSLGLVFVGLATLNVITMLQGSRPGQPARSRSRAIALHRAGGYMFIGLFAVMVWFMSKRLMGSPEGLAGDAAIHIALAVACSASLGEGNDRAEIQKPSLDTLAAWIVYLCHLGHAHLHPCAAVHAGEDQSVKLECAVFNATSCPVLRLSREFGSSPGRLVAEPFITICLSAAVAASRETAFRHVFS